MSHECHNSSYSIIAVCRKTSFTFLCSKDFLKITNGVHKMFGLYCGNKTDKHLRVTGDQVELTFRSDDEVEERGYYLVFTLVSPPSVSPPSVSPPSVSPPMFSPASFSPPSVSPPLVSHGKWEHKKMIKFYKFISLSKFPSFYFLTKPG